MTKLRVGNTASIILLGVLISGCQAYLVSTKIATTSSTKGELDGLYYALPKTVITASIPVKLINVDDGKYKEFADLFFGGASAPSLTFGTPKFTSTGQPDPRQMYLVKGKGRGAIAQTLTFTFSEAGAVTGLKAEVDNQTSSLVTSGISAALGVFGKLHYGQGGLGALCNAKLSAIDLFKNCILENKEELLKNFEKLSQPRQNQYANQYKSSAPFKQRFDEAMVAYNKIVDLLAKRTAKVDAFQLLPAEPLDAYWAKATELIKERTTAFKGKKSEIKWTAIFDIEPSECDATRQAPCTTPWISPTIIKYEPNTGICTHLDLRGEKLPAKMRATCGAGAKFIKLQLSFNPMSDQVVTRVANNFRRPSEAGVFFVVPARMRVQLIDGVVSPETPGNTLHGFADVMIAQRGVVTAMPSTIGGNALTHNLQFYDGSGALKSYTLVSKSNAAKGVLDSVSTSTNAILDARNKQAAVDANADFNKTKRESEILQLMLAKQKACAELINPPDECNP